MAMHEFNAPFAGEEANHFMFAETFCAESGILPLLVILELLTENNYSFERLLDESAGNLKQTGDVNIEITNLEKVMSELEKVFKHKGGRIDKIDGLMVELPDYHFSIRPSVNDPVLRLNLEAESEQIVKEKTEMIKQLVKKFDQ